MKKHILTGLFIIGFGLTTPSFAGEASDRAGALGIPTLERGWPAKWMPMDAIANPPSLHNGRYMLIVDRALTSYFFSPGGWLYNLAAYGDAREPSLWKRGHPAVKLKLDGVEYSAREAKYCAYRALRRNGDCNGVAVLTDTRMIDEARGVLTQITLTNTTLLPRKFRASLSMAREASSPDGVGVANTFQRAGAISVIRPSRKPDSVNIDAYIVAIWNYDLELALRSKRRPLGFVSGDGPAPKSDSDGVFIQGDVGNLEGRRGGRAGDRMGLEFQRRLRRRPRGTRDPVGRRLHAGQPPFFREPACA